MSFLDQFSTNSQRRNGEERIKKFCMIEFCGSSNLAVIYMVLISLSSNGKVRFLWCCMPFTNSSERVYRSSKFSSLPSCRSCPTGLCTIAQLIKYSKYNALYMPTRETFCLNLFQTVRDVDLIELLCRQEGQKGLRIRSSKEDWGTKNLQCEKKNISKEEQLLLI